MKQPGNIIRDFYIKNIGLSDYSSSNLNIPRVVITRFYHTNRPSNPFDIRVSIQDHSSRFIIFRDNKNPKIFKWAELKNNKLYNFSRVRFPFDSWEQACSNLDEELVKILGNIEWDFTIDIKDL